MKVILGVIVSALFLMSCQNEKSVDPYIIGKQHIGLLNDSTQIMDLDEIFAEDSIVQRKKGDEFMGSGNDVEIYSKEGNKLLVITPSQVLDSTAKVNSIQIFDSAYRTDKNVTSSSTFKDIKENYKITKISNLISSIVISVDEINASFTIDKKELPTNLRYDMDMKIEQSQIPDNAKIKYFMLHWN